MTDKRLFSIALLVLVVVVSGCADTETQEPVDIPEGDIIVEVGDMTFQQVDSDGENVNPEGEIDAEVGDEVVFYLDDTSGHDVTIEEFGISGGITERGETVRVTVDQEGEFLVDCTWHQGHDGTLTVS